MDLTGLVFGKAWNYRQLCIVSAIFGLVMLLTAYKLEGKSDLDFSVWGYLFGLLAFTGGLSLMESHSEWSKFGYLLIHIALVGISLLLKRKVFVVFGAIGIFGYLSNEAYTHFRNSVAFPFVISLIGIALIFLAMQYKRNETALQEKAATLLGRGAASGCA
jgi:membrane-associated HD superfamily phosphohydrolase